MPTPTQRERFEQVLRQLRKDEITTVMIVGAKLDARSAATEFSATAARAGTPGRYAGIVVPDGAWVHDQLVRRAEGSPGQLVDGLRVSFPPDAHDVAEAIVAAFEAAEFRPQWSGDGLYAVQVSMVDAAQ